MKQAGAEIIGDGSGLRYGGWTVETCKAPISSEALPTACALFNILHKFFFITSHLI